MKKGLIKLVLGTSLLASPMQTYSQSSSSNLNRLTESLSSCIRTNECDEFENLRKSLRVKVGASSLDGNELFYYVYGSDRYLGLVRDKKVIKGVNFYYADEIVNSEKGFDFVKGIEYKSGRRDAVIGNLSAVESNGRRVQSNWPDYKENHSNFLSGDEYNPEMEAIYGAITEINPRNIADSYKTAYISCAEAHESFQHKHEDLRGEMNAYKQELRISKFALMEIEKNLKSRKNDSRSVYYRSVAKEVMKDLIRKAGSKRKLYQMNSAQLRKLVGD